MTRVVITGMGAITPLGNDVETFWQNVVAGRSGVGPITLFNASSLKTRIAAEVRDFDPEAWFGRKEARRLDRYAQFALAAAQQALQDARLDPAHVDRERVGVVLGTGIGGIGALVQGVETLMTRGPDRISPFMVPMMLADTAPGLIAIAYGFRGPNMAVITACASGTNAIGEAMHLIRRGDADVVIAGGAEAAILPISVAAFNVMGAISTRNEEPERASRPFDRTRDGFVMGEGAGILVLERLEHARARGARIYAEVVGYGASADGYHITAPLENGEGAAIAMRRALADAGLAPREVNYINAHGTSTPLNDKSETQAIKAVFGEAAYDVPISSTKSMIGHLLGAAGAVEAIVCIRAITDGIIPPTINYEHPDPECDLDYVPNVARRQPVRVAMSNSFGFGGHNACVIFRRYEDEVD
ncbi:beta-ketoacyl-ACP synthase II [Thermoflexus sp.]|uniref:beta-ketoacyl-ACP synthase II n=3 Tax=Thermoflexus sp. TaxID=1969742 RepID=UPI0026004A7E|nr:beta-ketoacyl-ACP synthase II [Thermoflexus sp.]MCS7351159.1 beta-ketoacyl-ACP synthase II [Thermoflexus sp.]MCX7690455.1 beta-ketoacyl-ACP synthase II [Thermoflexus sp.]MDW8180613.1 beta-ketoacyl-ACP synthase II [Anaerolineae bacterium]MDW8184814.1 beta-ketoacyl-ACP synthase II [Anaerolineae bacterium]